MERLTKQDTIKVLGGKVLALQNSNNQRYFVKDNVKTSSIYNKLGELEDVMEKHSIESVNGLDKILTNLKKFVERFGKYKYHYSEKYMLDNKALEQENRKLKQQLQNAIVPKFKVGQIVWCVDNWHNSVGAYEVETIFYHRNKTFTYYVVDELYLESFNEENIFATQEEAKEKLKELKNGKVSV